MLIKKYDYFLLFVSLLLFSSFSPTFLQASSIVKELRSEEEGRMLVPHYRTYYKRGDKTEEEFMQGWNEIRNDPNYHCLAAFGDNAEESKGEVSKTRFLGFLDLTIFNSLYHRRMMRVDSIYIPASLIEREREIAELLFTRAFSIAKEQGVRSVIADTGSDVYDQEVRLFPLGMKVMSPENKIAYFTKLPTTKTEEPKKE